MRKAVVIGLFISLPLLSWGQHPTVSPGDTIRVTYSNIVTSRVTGELQHISDDSLHLAQNASTISLALSTVKNIDVNLGRRTWGGRGAAIGAVTGGLLTGVISMASTGSSESNSDPWGFDNIELFSSGEAFLLGFGLGAAGGALTGFIIGQMIETHRWEKVPLKIGVEPSAFRLAKNRSNYDLTLRLTF